MMKFLVAPNAFKGTLSGKEAAELISATLKRERPGDDLFVQPVADGGDGTCELLIESLGLEKIRCGSLNAIGQPILGFFGWDKVHQRAFLDVSTCTGLGILKDEQKNPWLASSFGTGILIQKAIQLGAKELVLGLGGSASIDLATGILMSFGFRFLDKSGREIPAFSPGLLDDCKHIQAPIGRSKVKFTCLCDVRNPFFGESGAVRVYGLQKGLEKNHQPDFELAVNSIFQLMLKKSQKSWRDQAGFGAAGGIAMGLDLFFQTEIKFGADYFFDQVKMASQIEKVDWVITGEGRFDAQSNQGKACFELLQLTRSKGKKIAIITSGDEANAFDFDLVMKLPSLDFTAPYLKEKAHENLHELVCATIRSGRFD